MSSWILLSISYSPLISVIPILINGNKEVSDHLISLHFSLCLTCLICYQQHNLVLLNSFLEVGKVQKLIINYWSSEWLSLSFKLSYNLFAGLRALGLSASILSFTSVVDDKENSEATSACFSFFDSFSKSSGIIKVEEGLMFSDMFLYVNKSIQ